jgi:hypothetical protein
MTKARASRARLTTEISFAAEPWIRTALLARAKEGERSLSAEIRRALRHWLQTEDGN